MTTKWIVCVLTGGLLLMAGCSDSREGVVKDPLVQLERSPARSAVTGGAGLQPAEPGWLGTGLAIMRDGRRAVGDEGPAARGQTGVPASTWFQAGQATAGDGRAGEGAGRSEIVVPAGEQDVTEQDIRELASKLGYVPREYRRGPAYPDQPLHSLGRFGKEFLPMVWDDTKYTFTKPVTWITFGLAGAAGIALQGPNADEPIADHFVEHGNSLNTFWDSVGDVGGNPGTHFAIGSAMLVGSYYADDWETYEISKSLLSALSINGLVTMGLKVAARTESPNGDEMGWPSGHTSSSFTVAAVAYEHYGPWAGIPLYLGASYVGFERVAARNHNFSDVISGAMMGAVIGHLVAGNHEPKVLGLDVVPYVHPEGGTGLALFKKF
ncbi:MAG: phosphatase PAP2 family protein [Planctomycetota bacterium]